MQNKDYSSRFGVSQSMLKDFRFKSPKRWKTIWIDRQEDGDKDDKSFTFGDLVDTLMFMPDTLNDRFYVGTQKLPSKAIETICRSIYSKIIYQHIEADEQALELPVVMDKRELAIVDSTNEDIIIEACNLYEEDGKKGWNNTWKNETRIKRIIEHGGDFFKSLVESNGRKIISPQMNFDAIEVKGILEKDDMVSKYFITQEDVDLEFQKEIFVDHICNDVSKIPLKGALDILRIDHKNKTIQIADFKTSFSAFDFIQSIKKYGYATQLSFYDYILRIWLKEQCDNKYCDYTILNPINIVIDPYEKIPYIYEYSWSDLAIEREGNEDFLISIYGGIHNHKIKRGWMDVLELVCWHYNNNYWEMPKELYEERKIKVNLLNN